MSKAPTFQKPDPQDIVGVGRGVTWPIGLGGGGEKGFCPAKMSGALQTS